MTRAKEIAGAISWRLAAGVAPGKLYVLIGDEVLEVSGFSVEPDALVDIGRALVEQLEQ